MFTYYLGLGSNVGNRIGFLQKACVKLQNQGQIIAKSSIYRSAPYGFKGQDFFFNAVIRYVTSLEPGQLLTEVKKVEIECGRKARFRWGPREIDIDLLDYNGDPVESYELTIPHIELEKRSFVLLPLAEIAADYQTRQGQGIHELLNTVEDSTETKIYKSDW